MSVQEGIRSRFWPRRSVGLALAGAGVLTLSGLGGAVVMAETRPSVSMAPATPVAIRSLPSAGFVTIHGRVAEVYGNKFVMDDGTGRALVDAEPQGGRRAPVAVGATVTVQGRFDQGFIHAAFLIGPDQKVLALGPLAGLPHGPHDGLLGEPDRGLDAPPPLAADGPPPPPRSSPRSGATASIPAQSKPSPAVVTGKAD